MEPMGPIWTGFVAQGGFARSIADTALLYDVLLTEPQGLAAAIADEPRALRIAISSDRAADQPIPQAGKIDAPWTRAADLTATILSQAGHAVEPARIKFGSAGLKFSIRYLASAAAEVAATDEPKRIEKASALVARLGRIVKRAMPWAMKVGSERAKVEASLKGFDLLLTPTMPCSAPPVGERDGKPAIVTVLKAAQRVSFLNVWNLLGWPGVSVPAGVDAQGLPVAALLTGRPGSERLLLQVAAQLERERPWELGKAV
jgi:amidase